MLPNLLLGCLRDVQAFRQKKCRFARVHVSVKSNNIKCKLKVLGTKMQKILLYKLLQLYLLNCLNHRFQCRSIQLNLVQYSKCTSSCTSQLQLYFVGVAVLRRCSCTQQVQLYLLGADVHSRCNCTLRCSCTLQVQYLEGVGTSQVHLYHVGGCTS